MRRDNTNPLPDPDAGRLPAQAAYLGGACNIVSSSDGPPRADLAGACKEQFGNVTADLSGMSALAGQFFAAATGLQKGPGSAPAPAAPQPSVPQFNS